MRAVPEERERPGAPRPVHGSRHPRDGARHPDLNPIEPAWAKLKGCLRTEAARSLDALEAALGPALATITAADAQGWFRCAGYPAPD